MTDVKTCANPVCSCIPPNKDKYCSSHCEGLGETLEVMCGCGHAICRGEVTEPVTSEARVELVPETMVEPDGAVGTKVL